MIAVLPFFISWNVSPTFVNSIRHHEIHYATACFDLLSARTCCPGVVPQERGPTSMNNFLKGALFSPDGFCLLTASEDSMLRVFEVPRHTLQEVRMVELWCGVSSFCCCMENPINFAEDCSGCSCMRLPPEVTVSFLVLLCLVKG